MHSSATPEFSLRAPWTAEQVEALNRYQTEGWMHPFTCGNPARTNDNHPHGGNLVATQSGWICEDCDYTQDWAHEFMFQPCPWPRFGAAV